MISIIRAIIVAMVFAAPVAAQELPEDSELAHRVSSEIPSWWEVTAFREIASSNVGDVAQPRALVRFEVDVSPTANLFYEVDRMRPFVMITSTHPAEEERVLYGVMELRYRAGEWSSSVQIENPVDELGVPRDMFAEPTLVVGSPEAETAISDLQMARESRAVAEFERALTDLQNEHQAAMQELRATQAAELAALESGHDEELARRQHELQQELTDLTEGLETRVEEARDVHDQTLAELERGQAAELENIRVEYARQRSALREELDAEIAALEVELAAEIERLERRLASSEEAQRLQAAYLESIEARNEAAGAVQTAMETAMARRVSLLQMLPTQYRGGVRCRDETGRFDQSWQLAFDVSDVNPSGMHGRFGINETPDHPLRWNSVGIANLVIRSEELALPLDARLSLADAEDAEHLPATVDVSISEALVISGAETDVWTIDGQSTSVTCVYELS